MNSSNDNSAISVELSFDRGERGEFIYPNCALKVSGSIVLSDCSSSNNAVNIKKTTKKIGSLEALVVNRGQIPAGYFLVFCDDYSSEMQWIGNTLFEPKRGRTRLQSLVQHDNARQSFCYIESFQIDPEYRQQQQQGSDVAAHALRAFLRHEYIARNCALAIYVLDGMEQMTLQERDAFDNASSNNESFFREPTQAEKEEMRFWNDRLNVLARQDANAFLRNGFFQDAAISRTSESNARILVATAFHWKQIHNDIGLKSHAQAQAIDFVQPPTTPPPLPTGPNLELFQLVCRREGGTSLTEETTRQEIQRLFDAGATLAESHALHAACANNLYHHVLFLLTFLRQRNDTPEIDGLDQGGMTPLACAAQSAAGRCSSKDGRLDDTRVLDALLQHGASKDVVGGRRGQQSSSGGGMTAYGYFCAARDEYDLMMATLQGLPSTKKSSSRCRRQQQHPTVLAVEQKLMPSNGPTAADLNRDRLVDGIVEYNSDDNNDHQDDDDDDDHLWGLGGGEYDDDNYYHGDDDYYDHSASLVDSYEGDY